MSKIIVIEGARGVGKSSLVRKLRDAMTNTIAINFTGNNGNTEEAKKQTFEHYNNWLEFFTNEKFYDTPYNYILDRFFFSEMVYSELYKDYNFEKEYEFLLNGLDVLSTLGMEVRVIHLHTGEEDLKRNLQREGKAHLFNDEKFADGVSKSKEQMEGYKKLFMETSNKTRNVTFSSIDCTGMTLNEVTFCVQHLIRQ